ncbi:hypothetical protein D3C73_1258060 [compost metagenome]
MRKQMIFPFCFTELPFTLVAVKALAPKLKHVIWRASIQALGLSGHSLVQSKQASSLFAVVSIMIPIEKRRSMLELPIAKNGTYQKIGGLAQA